MRRRKKPNPNRPTHNNGLPKQPCACCGAEKPPVVMKACLQCGQLVCITCRPKPPAGPRTQRCSKCTTAARRGT
jgi:hypothetical protein